MAESNLSPQIGLIGSTVLAASISVSPSAPPGETESTVDCRLVAGPESEDPGTAAMTMTVSYTLSDVGDPGVRRASASVTILGTFTLPEDMEDSAEFATSLKAAAMGALYPQVQAYLALLGGITPMGPASLPAIDPQAAALAMEALSKPA